MEILADTNVFKTISDASKRIDEFFNELNNSSEYEDKLKYKTVIFKD